MREVSVVVVLVGAGPDLEEGHILGGWLVLSRVSAGRRSELGVHLGVVRKC